MRAWVTKAVAVLAVTSVSAFGLTGTAHAAVCPASMAGAGNANSPCLIANATQLQAMRDATSLDYELTSDVDLSEVAWASFDFSGHFDGGGHTVSNLTVAPTFAYEAMFMGVDGSITRLRLRNASTDALVYGALLVGRLEAGGSIDKVFIDGGAVHSAAAYVGALVGLAENGSHIADTLVTASVETTSVYTGGAIGLWKGDFEAGSYTGSVTNSLMTGTVQSSFRNSGWAVWPPTFGDGDVTVPCSQLLDRTYYLNTAVNHDYGCLDAGKSEAQLKRASTYAAWDHSIWSIGNGAYPELALFAEPAVTSLNPNNGPASGGSTVTIRGSGFVDDATVTIGGVPCTSVSVDSGTSLTCVTGASAAGSVSVGITNPNTNVGTKANAFTYIGAAIPAIPSRTVQTVSLSLPNRVRKGKKYSLVARTDQGMPLGWTVTSGKGCTVKKLKLSCTKKSNAKRVVLTATASGSPQLEAYRQSFSRKVA